MHNIHLSIVEGFPGGSEVKNLSITQEMWVQSLGQEDPVEEEMATLQYSCLENLMELRAWQVVVHGVAKSWTRLK